jgi:sugar/nucleoside kinase (ribokinase family)
VLVRLTARGPSIALATLGAQGARWAEAGRGAVHAALGIALAEGRPTDDAVAWACAAAAFKCERGGGVEGAPTRLALQTWLRARRVTSM